MSDAETTPSEDKPDEQKKHSKLRWLLRQTRRLIVLLSLGLLLFVAGFVIYAWQVNARGEQAVQQIRSDLSDRGLLNLYTDLHAYEEDAGYQLKANAAAYWRAAMEAVPEAGDRPLLEVGLVGVNTIEPLQQYHPDTVAALREVFETHPRFLQLVEDARNAPHGRFQITPTLSDPLKELDLLGNTRQVARWLHERSHLAAVENDGETYVESIAAILDLSDILAQEPSVIAALVSASIDALARHAVMDGLSRIQLSADQLEQLAEAFEARQSSMDPLFYIGHDLSWQYHFMGPDVQSYLQYNEATQTLRTRHMIITHPEWYDDTELPADTGRLWSNVILNACPGRYELRFAEHMHKSLGYYDQLKKLENKPKQRWAWIKSTSDRIKQQDDEEHDGLRYMQGNDVVITARSMTRIESTLALAPVALRVERYRVENSKWPDKLSDVIKDTPLDAYGEPIRYRKTVDGVLVYNVGDNGIDEQGYGQENPAPPTAQFPDADDWAFTLYNPELRNAIPPPADAVDPDYDDPW